ncbi:MAG: HNH endonuclease [Gemmatimonadales bacterium]
MDYTGFDFELRVAAFAHIQRLRLRHAGRIPRQELNAGIEFKGRRIPIWNQMKGIFKPAVLGPTGAALSIQTSVDSPYEDEHDPGAGHFIYKYRGTDPNQSDNIALRSAMLEGRPLLYLVAVDPGFYDAIIPVYVIGDDASNLQFTLVADQLGALKEVRPSAGVAYRREYATRAVIQRLHQAHFRRIVLRAYHERCAICRLRHVNLLDAAHILRDRHPKGEPVVTNGLGLCKIHHSAFDADILGIDSDARVHIRTDVLLEKDGPMLKHGLQELHGSKLVLPTKVLDRPNRDFLAERFGEFQSAH